MSWERDYGLSWPGTKVKSPDTDKGCPKGRRASSRPYQEQLAPERLTGLKELYINWKSR